MGNTVTGVVDEKDGTVAIKGEDGKEVRYVKESDLLAIKGSRVSKEDVAKEVEAAKSAAVVEANTKLEAEHQKALQAEARVSSLQEQINKGGVDMAELARIKQELATAKTSSEELGNKYLELRRNVIIATYGAPKATVESKKLAELDLFEEALKAVLGAQKLGNFAVGGGGGASPLQGMKPMDLAREAYSQSK